MESLSIKYGYPLKFDEIVVRNVAQVESDSISVISRAMLQAASSVAAASFNLAVARNIACNFASYGQLLT